jgi:hypothetical protein
MIAMTAHYGTNGWKLVTSSPRSSCNGHAFHVQSLQSLSPPTQSSSSRQANPTLSYVLWIKYVVLSATREIRLPI